MDIATVIGICLGIFLIGGSIAIGPSPIAFANAPSAMIVIGGTIAATLIRFPLASVLRTSSVAKNAFLYKAQAPDVLIKTIVSLAEKARRESFLALEDEKVDDAFLARGIQFCVDGTEPDVVANLMVTEMNQVIGRHQNGQKILKGMGAAAPAFGMIGTLIGLVQMLVKMDDPSKIGPSMAVAILTTFYGAFMANLLFLPMADKLAGRTAEEMLNRQIIIHGIQSILSGHHPRVIEAGLLGYMDPKSRELMSRERNEMKAAA
ncbi:MAG: MotA/TolQ/ExbB proton channel family protein [Candidatus Eisenbacteria bacterium]|uniref:MotA/TolQ/ExbB proton channel family protein n=1 Tax=Eiseniibacteriota bacterium TaxID=2212470 RepID=A0A948RZ59_UNCEI|nr:MotA/TolQ/ExbB proton channel family protein [Candidatus Eisenbacteria bacterium]MBU1947288.1 MotA/TolQ/ExbB proton channel family protein [Candidatus Eisenbacteria bacterium]MBU2691827.1 MotA/TolQ/ExbB proton channel family protein [Candidatus Eisenbacteria bacterium]